MREIVRERRGEERGQRAKTVPDEPHGDGRSTKQEEGDERRGFQNMVFLLLGFEKNNKLCHVMGI